MDALQALLSVRDRGVDVWVENGQLRFQAPKGALRPEDMQQLRALKQEIVALMTGEAAEFGIPLERRRETDVVPWTAFQQSVGYLTAQGSGPHPRVHAFAVRIDGELRVDILEAALQRVSARHEILRTRLTWHNGYPVQCIDPFEPEPLIQVDLSREAGATVGRLERTLDAFLNTRVQAEEGPLSDARLIRLSRSDYVLVVSLDSMITDCKSNELLLREIWDMYARVARGQGVETQAPGLQFSDYAVWLHKVRAPWNNLHAAYWQARFPDSQSVNEAPASRTAHRESVDNQSVPVSFGEEVIAGLLQFARGRQIYPAVIVLTAAVSALSLWRGREDLTVMVVDSGRYRPELQSMIGPIVQRLFLRVVLSTGQTLAELLRRTNQELGNSRQHRDFNWMLSQRPRLPTDLYFNWVTSHDESLPPADAQVSDLGIRLRTQPLSMVRQPLPSFGLIFRRDTRLAGYLAYDPTQYTQSELSEFVSLLTLQLQRIVTSHDE